MSLKTIKNENGIYVELPKDKIEFVSKEAEIIYDLSLENDFLEKENQELKEEINKISKKELKVRDMLYSIENGILTRERLMQIEEALFEIESDIK